MNEWIFYGDYFEYGRLGCYGKFFLGFEYMDMLDEEKSMREIFICIVDFESKIRNF